MCEAGDGLEAGKPDRPPGLSGNYRGRESRRDITYIFL